jgi:predicted nucleic acid-binding protein
MIVTLDASAAVELVMGRPKRELVARSLEKAEVVIAPALFVYELANTMWKYHRLSGIEVHTLLRMARRAMALVDELIDPDTVWEESVALACQIAHPVYDAVYLVTSRRRHAELVSIDSRLVAAAAQLNIPVASLT